MSQRQTTFSQGAESQSGWFSEGISAEEMDAHSHPERYEHEEWGGRGGNSCEENQKIKYSAGHAVKFTAVVRALQLVSALRCEQGSAESFLVHKHTL